MVQSKQPDFGSHEDPGLQPERTTLAWARTMMALVTVSAIFLRWLPHHGMPILLLVSVSLAAAAAICLTQRRRYSSSAHGLKEDNIAADIAAVLWTGFMAFILGGLGFVILFARHR